MLQSFVNLEQRELISLILREIIVVTSWRKTKEMDFSLSTYSNETNLSVSYIVIFQPENSTVVKF